MLAHSGAGCPAGLSCFGVATASEPGLPWGCIDSHTFQCEVAVAFCGAPVLKLGYVIAHNRGHLAFMLPAAPQRTHVHASTATQFPCACLYAHITVSLRSMLVCGQLRSPPASSEQGSSYFWHVA